jgi:hypothetical protein
MQKHSLSVDGCDGFESHHSQSWWVSCGRQELSEKVTCMRFQGGRFSVEIRCSVDGGRKQCCCGVNSDGIKQAPIRIHNQLSILFYSLPLSYPSPAVLCENPSQSQNPSLLKVSELLKDTTGTADPARHRVLFQFTRSIVQLKQLSSRHSLRRLVIHCQIGRVTRTDDTKESELSTDSTRRGCAGGMSEHSSPGHAL